MSFGVMLEPPPLPLPKGARFAYRKAESLAVWPEIDNIVTLKQYAQWKRAYEQWKRDLERNTATADFEGERSLKYPPSVLFSFAFGLGVLVVGALCAVVAALVVWKTIAYVALGALIIGGLFIYGALTASAERYALSTQG
jgi:hypothetical protein